MVQAFIRYICQVNLITESNIILFFFLNPNIIQNPNCKGFIYI